MERIEEGSFPGYLGHGVFRVPGMRITQDRAAPLWIYDVYRHVLSRTKLVRA